MKSTSKEEIRLFLHKLLSMLLLVNVNTLHPTFLMKKHPQSKVFTFTSGCYGIFENDLRCQEKMHHAKDEMVRAAKMCLEVCCNICDGIFWKTVSSHSFERIARTSPNLTHHHFYLKLIWCQSLMTIWKPESPNSELDLGASGGLTFPRISFDWWVVRLQFFYERNQMI